MTQLFLSESSLLKVVSELCPYSPVNVIPDSVLKQRPLQSPKVRNRLKRCEWTKSYHKILKKKKINV